MRRVLRPSLKQIGGFIFWLPLQAQKGDIFSAELAEGVESGNHAQERLAELVRSVASYELKEGEPAVLEAVTSDAGRFPGLGRSLMGVCVCVCVCVSQGFKEGGVSYACFLYECYYPASLLV